MRCVANAPGLIAIHLTCAVNIAYRIGAAVLLLAKPERVADAVNLGFVDVPRRTVFTHHGADGVIHVDKADTTPGIIPAITAVEIRPGRLYRR